MAWRNAEKEYLAENCCSCVYFGKGRITSILLGTCRSVLVCCRVSSHHTSSAWSIPISAPLPWFGGPHALFNFSARIGADAIRANDRRCRSVRLPKPASENEETGRNSKSEKHHHNTLITFEPNTKGKPKTRAEQQAGYRKSFKNSSFDSNLIY